MHHNFRYIFDLACGRVDDGFSALAVTLLARVFNPEICVMNGFFLV